MKKLLISTALLSTVAVVSATQSVDAANNIEDQKTQFGVTFQGEDNPVTDKGVGNIVMGLSPSKFTFENAQTNITGSAVQLKDVNERQDSKFVMINEDRAANSADNKPTGWTLKMKYNPLRAGDASWAKQTLKSNLKLDVKDIYEYDAGDIVFPGTPQEDYTFPKAKDGKKGQYDVDGADSLVKSTVLNTTITLNGQDPATPVLTKANGDIDKGHTNNANQGNRNGGLGYLLEFKNPLLTVEESTLELEGKTYSSELVYSLDLL